MLRLGLDLGTNSIGWALYRLDGEKEPEALLDGGVLIHSDGRDPQSRASNAAQRREKRGPRRNRDRTLRRQRRLANLLHDLDLLPEGMAERAAARDLDPLELRAEALDRTLTPHELGRALLAFADRRGFRSNRKTDKGDDGAIRRDTGELRRRIGQSGARTLGEYLWRRRRQGKTIRARLGNGLYPDRAMVEAELRAIRAAQAPHHPDVAESAWDKIIEALLYQRDMRPVERGRCTLLPEEERAYKAYPLFQHFRIWQEVLNVEVAPPGEKMRPLSDAEREGLVNDLLRIPGRKEQDFDKIAAKIGLPEGARINLRTRARQGIKGDQTAALLRASKRFGRKGWERLSLEQQQTIVERVIEDSDAERLEAWLRDEFSLSPAAAEAVASCNNAREWPKGTANLSAAAIERLLPHMRAGKRYHEAVTAAGFESHSDLGHEVTHDRLPYYGEVLWRQVAGSKAKPRSEVERYGRIANPTVHIALGQMRRLFNEIVEHYGKPHQVVIELARDLKQTDEERQAYQEQQGRNRERNERLREAAETAGYPDPSPGDMRKLRLWEEQGPVGARLCPFTGEPLSIGRVLSAETEIEHILPFSRTLDDSMNNTVVAMRSANREKGNRTPAEAWSGPRYEEILARTRNLLPPSKQWRFEEYAMERWTRDRDFLDRQLNETRHLSRAIREYLEVAVPRKHIWVTPGRLTSRLRHAWGLNTILSDTPWKNREDHRHHLIDAAVIGMTSHSRLQQIATASGRGTDIDSRIIGAMEPQIGRAHV